MELVRRFDQAHPKMLRYFLIGCFIHLLVPAQSQDIFVIEPFDNSYRSKKTYYRNPSELVDLLTKDKDSEHEKFQAIFYWVINNIDYDYWSYLSKRGRPSSSIRRILKRRVALCGDYANLMDTLCLLAGIQSQRVDGYAKDEIFDVHDSIYIANHAWNIVRLNNLWYPYDITWSKGSVAWRYTRFSQWIVNQKQKLKYEIVKIPIKDKYRKYYRTIKCNEVTERTEETEITRFTHKYVFKQKFRKWLLDRFAIRVVIGYKESKSTDFFLAEPEVFYLTHTPEDPAYSLIRSQAFRHFESDSNYYHLSPANYEQQNRNGRTCPDCVNALAGTELEKAVRHKYKSLSYNRKNKFTPAMCDYKIGVIKFEESLPLQDSASKIELLDTSLSLLNESREFLAKSAASVRDEFTEQKQKNRKKFNSVLDSVNGNRRFIRGQIQRVYSETRDIRDLENSLRLDLQTYTSRRTTLKTYKRSEQIRKENRNVQKTIDYLREELEKNDRNIDSLNELIESTRYQFSEFLPDLSSRIWQRVKEQDSLIAPLSRRIYLRGSYYDDYKKAVVTQSECLRNRKVAYSENVDSLVLKPSGICYEAGKKISQLVRERNRQRLTGYKLRYQLYQFKVISAPEFDSYLETMTTENDGDICWIKSNAYGLPGLFYGFKAMVHQHEQFEKWLVLESKIEGKRYSAIEKELKRRKQQRLNIISNNRRVVMIKAREVKKNKRDFLKSLRDERKEEKRQARKSKI